MNFQAMISAHMSVLVARSAEIAALRREEDIDEAVRQWSTGAPDSFRLMHRYNEQGLRWAAAQIAPMITAIYRRIVEEREWSAREYGRLRDELWGRLE